MQLRLVSLLALVAVFTSQTASAFTPDAAFKRSQMGLSAGNAEDRKNVFVYTQSTNDKRRRSAFVSTVDNLRKSVTSPPSFDDYMSMRRQQMSEVAPTNNKQQQQSEEEKMDSSSRL